METLLLYYLQANLYLLFIFIMYRFGIRKSKDFRFARPFLLVGIGLSLLLPLLKLSSLSFTNSSTDFTHFLSEVIITQNTSYQLSNWSSISIYTLLYMTASLILTINLLIRIIKIKILTQKATFKDDYYLLPEQAAAFSFLNWTFIGSALSQEEQKIALAHEKIHVAKGHSIDILFCHLLEIVFWFNPFVFKLKGAFKEIHEYEADELSCNNPTAYINLLLKQNFNHLDLIPVHQFNSSHLKQRIMRIKNRSNQRVSKGQVLTLCVLLIGLFFFNQQLNSAALGTTSSPSNTANQQELDKVAKFPGGQEALKKFMLEHTVYPKELVKKQITGTVQVEFMIDKNGKPSKFKVLKHPHEGLKKVALKTISQMPNWEAAEKDGKKVASKMVLPFKFDLRVPPPPKSSKLPPPPPPPAPPAPPRPVE